MYINHNLLFRLSPFLLLHHYIIHETSSFTFQQPIHHRSTRNSRSFHSFSINNRIVGSGKYILTRSILRRTIEDTQEEDVKKIPFMNTQKDVENDKDIFIILDDQNKDCNDFREDSNNGMMILRSSTLLDTMREKIFLGIRPTPDILAIMAIYFVEGALGLARLAQTFFLKDTLHLGPAEMAALTGIFALPWTVKPIYGFISDGIPIFGYRRRSYLIICGLVGALCYIALGTDFFGYFSLPDDDITVTAAADVVGPTETISSYPSSSLIQATTTAFITSSACIAFSDVVADGIVVEKTRDSNDPMIAGGLQSLCWGSAALGGIMSAYFSGSLLEIVTPKDVFLCTSILPFIVAFIAFSITEESKSKVIDDNSVVDRNTLLLSNESDMNQVQLLWNALKEPKVWKPILFLFLWKATPTGEGAFLYFMTNDLGFGPEFLGRARLISAISSLVGVWCYQKYLRSFSIRSILLWTTIISTPLGLTQLLLITHINRSLGIPDGAFVLGDDVILSILSELAFLPTLVLAARICPPGVEAVLFATLMSIFNGASTVGTEIGATMTKYLGITESNFDNLGLLTLICNVSSLFPLFFIGLLDGIDLNSEEERDIS